MLAIAASVFTSVCMFIFSLFFCFFNFLHFVIKLNLIIRAVMSGFTDGSTQIYVA